MSWLVFALCGPILWAISVHLDKYLVERYFKDADVIVLLIFTALMGLVLMPIIAWFEPGVFQRDLTSIVLMTLSGLFYMTGITFYLRALQGHEASMVAPFFQSSPLFGYVLAYLVLGETLTPHAACRRRADHRRRAVRLDRRRAEARALPLAACRADALRGLRAVAVDADLQGVRDQGRVLGHHVLDVRGRGAVRRGLSLHRPLSPAVRRALPVERRRR